MTMLELMAPGLREEREEKRRKKMEGKKTQYSSEKLDTLAGEEKARRAASGA